MAVQTIMTDLITLDHSLQSRSAMNEMAIREYQEAIETSLELPPIVVFHDSQKYYIADGWHRLEAHKRAGRDRISADIRNGSHRDAFLHALSANATHGLRRSQADKRRAVQMALDDSEIGNGSNREIAKVCMVSHTFVKAVRESLGPKPAVQSPATKASNWPEPARKVETFPPDMSEEATSYESYTAQDEALDTIAALAEENERLNDRLAIAALDATEEEKAQAAETIADLRLDLNRSVIECKSLKDSRNFYQNENADLKRQCQKYQAIMKKLNQQIASLQDELSFYRAIEGGGSRSSQPLTHPGTHTVS